MHQCSGRLQMLLCYGVKLTNLHTNPNPMHIITACTQCHVGRFAGEMGWLERGMYFPGADLEHTLRAS